jgi:hypothetical protein
MNNPVRGVAVLSDWGRQAAVIGAVWPLHRNRAGEVYIRTPSEPERKVGGSETEHSGLWNVLRRSKIC